MRKETKKTNRSLSFQELLEKNAYIHYIICRKMSWTEYRRMKQKIRY